MGPVKRGDALRVRELEGIDGLILVPDHDEMACFGEQIEEDLLGKLRENRDRLVVSRGRLRATLFRKGRRIWSARVGIGKPGTPTPAGSFYVRERLRLGRGGGPYGSFAFGTSAYSPGLSDWPGGGVVGVHGTDKPGLIPGRVSHGCVRLRNGDINKLRRLMGLGTPVLIR